MATTFQIEMDYRVAMGQAEHLEDAARKVRDQIQDLRHSEGSVRASWQGEDAEWYISKMCKTERDLLIMEKKLRRAAEVTRSVAKSIYMAEKRAIEIANMRGYR